MYLKKIELHGFKSFPDKISLDFDNVIAAVVGPNGSGKSNIADAIRWVLGEQSVKSLRGQKWEDVIFSGTQNRRPLGFAEVSMTIDNSSKQLSCEYTEVTVTRRVFRSGDSEYLINGKNVRLKDVRELFMDTGVGKEGYSIIGQGRIDEILNARSEERRLIFEEASGIVKYKTRRQDAFAKLEAEKKNLTRVTDILSEIESSLGTLYNQQLKAKKYIELSESLKHFQVNIFLVEEQRLKEEAAKISEVFENNKQTLDELEIEKNDITQKINSLKSRSAVVLSLIEETKEKVFEAKSKQEQHTGEIKINESNISHYNKDLRRIAQEISLLSEKITKNENELILLESKKNREVITLSANDKLLADVTKQLEELSKHLSVSETEIEHYKDSMIENMKHISEANSVLTRLNSLKEHASERQEIVQDARVSIQSSLRQKANLLQSLGAKKEAGQLKLNGITENKARLIAEKESKSADAAELTKQYESASQELIKNKERFKVLSSMAKEHEGFYKSVKEVLKSAESGLLTGVCGAVGDMLSVSAEYEIAIEITLGASIQNIIVEDESAAKRAIEFLKRGKLGRATFLPLTSVKTNNKIDDKVLKNEGIIGVAKSLVAYDKKYEKVVSSLLERVIVAEDMNSAVNFSKKTGYSYRVVTLKGELLSPQGAITGGSLNEKMTNVFSRNREILEIEERLANLAEKKDYYAAQISCVEREIAAVKASLDVVYKETEETLILINTLEQKIESEQKEYAAAKEQSDHNEEELAQISAQIKEISESIAVKQAEIEALELKGKAIDDSISEMQTLNQSERDLRDQKLAESANLRVTVSETNGLIDSLKTEIGRLNKDNINSEKSSQIYSQEQKQTEEKIKSAHELIEELCKKVKELDEQRGCMEREISESEQEKQNLEKDIEAACAKQNELNENITKLGGENIRLESKRERAEEERQRLFNEMWEEYEITLKEARQYDVLDMPPNEMHKNAKKLKGEIRTLGNVNVASIEQYKETKERFEYLTTQKNDIISAEKKLKEIINDLTEMMEKTFVEQFTIISENFNAVFKEMFGGGRARLELNDKEHPLESGIEIVAELPGKKLQNISLLSGGERALTAIALLFGILKLKPSPFCVLDEIEAALDDANISRFADYLKRLQSSTQFIVITHRKGTMEAANVLYGVTMEEQGVSKLISLNLESAV